ncbi:translocation/assembly module TamB domain-containing protein [Marinobacter caseinilyticus]|uniref:translocation/assembly module TamB domain-containing protein n=1 Tax=Marinobacter caseinilyticus TaxID=2692195 RepID=UPI001F47BBB0|nr:translocation/assembly module TamB domain-containing protein [Marinobacter caseinilyticus]
MSRSRKLRRWLLAGLALVILVPVLLVVAVVLTLRTDAGTAWVIDQVPGLEVENGQGTLLGIWQAETLKWNGYGVGVEVASPYLDWSPVCLFQATFCLESLQTDRLDVVVQPGTEAKEPSPVSLPALTLPLDLDIANVRLGPFTLNKTPVWDTVTLEAQGAGTDLNIQSLYFKREAITVSASGYITTRGDWPLALDVSAQLPPPSGDALQVDLELSGSVNDLRVHGRTEGYLNAEVDGQASPLDPALPARLNLKSDQFQALDTLPATLTLNHWTLGLKGSLAGGFNVDTQAQLPGARGPIELALTGIVTTQQAKDLRLTLAAPYQQTEGPSEVALSGVVDWSQALDAELDFRLRRFPWYDLLPGTEPLPVTLTRLRGKAHYNDGRYEASLEAGLQGPLGDTALGAEVKGDLAQVNISNLRVETGAGGIKGDARLAFAGPLSWDAQLVLDQLNPGYWMPALEASLTGSVTSAGTLTDEATPEASATVDLAGSWQSNETRVIADVAVAPGHWRVHNLELMVGDNTVQGSGQWADTLTAMLTLDLPDLSAFLPGLEGQLKGTVDASGQLETPTARVELSGSDVRWQKTVQVASLSMAGTLGEERNVDASVKASGIEAGGQTVSQLTLGIGGTMANHTLTVAATHTDGSTSLRFAGGWDSGWRGVLAAARLNLPKQDQSWVLKAPAELRYQPSGELFLGQHCFEWQSSSLCADDQVLLPRPDLHYRVNNIPTSVLAPYLPESVRWQARINGSFELVMSEAGPSGRIELDAGPGEVQFKARESWQSLPYDTLRLNVGLTPDEAELALALAGPGLGNFSVEMTIDPDTADRPVDGRFELDGLDVALASLFVDLEQIAGEVSGQGTFNGPLMSPEVFGEIALSGGLVRDPSLPLPLEDIVLSLELKGREADILGHWRSNERSKGSLDGRLAWSGSPSVDLNIKGDRLPFSYEPYARLELKPDIAVSFKSGSLRIAGQVDIPRGEIEVRSLPEQAVSVSDDEVIVGQEAEESGLESLVMDVTVNVGKDRVSFEGFGVTGDLAGSLRIGDGLDTRGALQLNEGNYEVYGQKLDLRRARLVFVGPISEPYLDIEAIRKVNGVTAGIRLSGPVSEPASEVFSEPSLPQSEALAYLVFGRPLRNSGEQGQLGQAALAIGLAQTSDLTRGLGEQVGIKNFALEAEGSGDSSSVVASGYLTKDLSVRYGVGVFEPITKVALRYDLGQYFYLEAASGLAASLDLFYTRDF